MMWPIYLALPMMVLMVVSAAFGASRPLDETAVQPIIRQYQYRGECDWADMYTGSDVPQKCWIPGSTDEPTLGDIILTSDDDSTVAKEKLSSADPCDPDGRLATDGDNGIWPATYCVYVKHGITNASKIWRTLDIGGGAVVGTDEYYDGSAVVQNYSDASFVVFSRGYSTAGGGPLTNGGILAVCGEDGTYGTDNDCDVLAVADNEGTVVFLVETLTAAGDSQLSMYDGAGSQYLQIDKTDLLMKGTLMGNRDVVVTTGDTDSPSADEMRGTLHIADNATAANDVDYTLPEISTIGTGANACFYDNGGGNGGIIIDAAAGDEILLNGTGVGVADAIDSPGVAGAGANGDYICITAIDNTYWVTLDASGTWVDGGAD